jgi:hypothetical protein
LPVSLAVILLCIPPTAATVTALLRRPGASPDIS